MTKLDLTGSCITVNGSDVLCVDGIKVLRLVERDNAPWVQFCDRNRERCRIRGSNCVEIPLDAFVSRIVKMCERQ
jgi:hypothetical protein